MATKKKASAAPTEEQAAVLERVQEEAFTPPAPESVDAELQDFLEKARVQYIAERKKALEPKVLCRHENKHHRGLKNTIEPLFCDLSFGHDGPHEANYDCLREDDGSYEHSILEHQKRGNREFVVVTERAYWMDRAATPVGEIKPDLDQLAYIRQHKKPIDGKAYAESHASK